MKKIIYILALSLFVFNCSKDDIKVVNPTFLEKYDGTTWKYWNFMSNPPKFYFRFIYDLNNPVEYWWRSDSANESNNYCFEHEFVTLSEENRGSISINTYYKDKGILDNERSNGILEYRAYRNIDGIEYLDITSFDISNNIMIYEYELYKNEDLIKSNTVVFSGHMNPSHVDGLILCDE